MRRCGKQHVSTSANIFYTPEGRMLSETYCFEHNQYEPAEGCHEWHKPRLCGYCHHPLEDNENPDKCPCCETQFEIELPKFGHMGMVMMFEKNAFVIESGPSSRVGRGSLRFH